MPDAGGPTDDALAHRGLPRQRRAIERRRAILDAALALLDTHGLEALTTSSIAQHAGIPVASVYAYFPNKLAVVAELAREAMDEVDTRIASLLPERITRESLAEAVENAITTVLAGYRAVPARLKLFSSIRGNAALLPVLRDSDDRMIRLLAARLAHSRPDLPPARIRAIAQTVVATFTAMQDYVLPCEVPEDFSALIREWKDVITLYLGAVLT